MRNEIQSSLGIRCRYYVCVLPKPVVLSAFLVKLHNSIEKIVKRNKWAKWHNKNTKYKCTV